MRAFILIFLFAAKLHAAENCVPGSWSVVDNKISPCVKLSQNGKESFAYKGNPLNTEILDFLLDYYEQRTKKDWDALNELMGNAFGKDSKGNKEDADWALKTFKDMDGNPPNDDKGQPMLFSTLTAQDADHVADLKKLTEIYNQFRKLTPPSNAKAPAEVKPAPQQNTEIKPATKTAPTVKVLASNDDWSNVAVQSDVNRDHRLPTLKKECTAPAVVNGLDIYYMSENFHAEIIPLRLKEKVDGNSDLRELDYLDIDDGMIYTRKIFSRDGKTYWRDENSPPKDHLVEVRSKTPNEMLPNSSKDFPATCRISKMFEKSGGVDAIENHATRNIPASTR